MLLMKVIKIVFFSNDVDFFDLFYDGKFNNIEVKIKHVKKKIHFRDVIIFINKIKKVIKVKDAELFRNNF